MRSKFVIIRLTNRIKKLKETLVFYEIKEKKMKLVEKKDDQICHNKQIKEAKKKKCCILNLKLIVLIFVVFFLVLSINKNVKDEKCTCMHFELP